MKTRGGRVRAPRYRRSNRARPGRRWLIFGAAALLVWGCLSEAGLAAVDGDLPQGALRRALLGEIRRAVEETVSDEEELVTVTRDGEGQILSAQADAAGLNRLRAALLADLERRLSGKVTVRVPLGSLTPVGVLNGRGPEVPLRLSLEAAPDVSFQTEFLSAGLNQSCHRVSMTVTVRAHSPSARFPAETEVSTTTVLGETVIVGRVPEAAGLWPGGTA